MLKKIKKLDDGATLMRDDRTGIAAIHNGRDGVNPPSTKVEGFQYHMMNMWKLL
jgi:hypothetical protein